MLYTYLNKKNTPPSPQTKKNTVEGTSNTKKITKKTFTPFFPLTIKKQKTPHAPPTYNTIYKNKTYKQYANTPHRSTKNTQHPTTVQPQKQKHQQNKKNRSTKKQKN